MVAHTNEMERGLRGDLAKQFHRLRDEPIGTLRRVAMNSAGGIKSMKAPVRAVAHSGVKFTTVSQTAVQSFIELESEVITSAMTDVAMRLERAAQAEGVLDLVFDQAELLGATRERIVDHATRAVAIFTLTGRDLREVARHAYERLMKPGEERVAEVKRARRKTKRAVRKTPARTRKAAA